MTKALDMLLGIASAGPKFKAIDTWIELNKAGFSPIDANNPKHFAAIGRFLLAVGSEIDSRLNVYLQQQVSSPEEAVTRILVGEMRIGDVTASLRRIGLSRSMTTEDARRMDALLKEIYILRQARDVVAHRACMVAGNRLAFHNAFLAKTDDAIEVKIYTIAELKEFSQYAKRLGYRITQVFGSLTPAYRSQAQHAWVAATIFGGLQKMTIALANAKKSLARRRSTLSLCTTLHTKP